MLMKRILVICVAILAFAVSGIAQTAGDSPATKADVERYLQAIHSHDLMIKMAAAMSQGTKQMVHQQYLMHKDQLPPDYESKMTVEMNGMFQNMPWDDMTQAMVPAFEKHLTKGDIDNLIAFYSTPTGEKLLREMPTIMTESMQDMTPIMVRYMQTIQQHLQKETDTMIAQSRNNTAPAAKN